MIRCNVCVNHKKKGKEHICSKCNTKIIYGVMQEPFIECCQYFTMTEKAVQRSKYPMSTDPATVTSEKTTGCRGRSGCHFGHV